MQKNCLGTPVVQQKTNSSPTQAWGFKPYKALTATGNVPNLTTLICGFLEEENYKAEQVERITPEFI